jgi:hypothetical protein
VSRWLAGLVATLAVGLLAVPSAAAVERRVERPAADSPLSVVLDETALEVGPGQRIEFTSTVRNTGEQPVTDLVAHVAILTSDADVYVDPEDWSPRRTQYVDRLAGGEETTLSWNVQAVTAGPIILYVDVTDPASDTVAVSGPLYMTVTGRREVNSEDAFPLVAGVPAAVLLLLGLTGVRRRLRR